jgi:hypothetical protein
MSDSTPELWRITGAGAPAGRTLKVVERVATSRPSYPIAAACQALPPGPPGRCSAAELDTRFKGSIGGIALANLGGRCIVPDLIRDDLAQARLEVANHSCPLGKVRTLRHELPRRSLLISCQKPKPRAPRRPRARVRVTRSDPLSFRRCRG